MQEEEDDVEEVDMDSLSLNYNKTFIISLLS